MERLGEGPLAAKGNAKLRRRSGIEEQAEFSRDGSRRHMEKHTLAEAAQDYDPGLADRSTVLRMTSMLDALKPLRPKMIVMGLTLAGRPLLFDLESRKSLHILIEEADEARASELLRNLVCSLALTTIPAQAQLFPVDMGGRGLAAIGGLPHSPRGMVSNAESLQTLLHVLAKELRRRQESKVPIPHLVIAVHEIHLFPQRGLAAQLEGLLRLGAAGGPFGVHLFMTGSLGTMEGLQSREELHGLALVAPGPVVEGTIRRPLVVAVGGRTTAFTAAELTVHDLDWACRQIAVRGRQDFLSRGVGLWPAGLYESTKGQHDAHGERPRH